MSRADTQVRSVAVAAVTDVPPGWALTVTIGPRRIAVANCDGTFYALDDVCSHAGGPLGDNRLKDGCFLECPWHNSVFEARTGEIARGPARKPQATYPVEVRDGTLFVTIES